MSVAKSIKECCSLKTRGIPTLPRKPSSFGQYEKKKNNSDRLLFYKSP